jgi:hypothetical protein
MEEEAGNGKMVSLKIVAEFMVKKKLVSNM